MVILENYPFEHVAQCQHCCSVVSYDYNDLKWSHTDEDDYYLVCPKCGNYIWLNGNDELDEMWKKQWNERKNNK